ncbi:MAG: hypothetical protein K2X36_03835 [Microbacteriaceae bacterium]|nr:hypothetical protein [Microbacteriaceae bacterium]
MVMKAEDRATFLRLEIGARARCEAEDVEEDDDDDDDDDEDEDDDEEEDVEETIECRGVRLEEFMDMS